MHAISYHSQYSMCKTSSILAFFCSCHKHAYTTKGAALASLVQLVQSVLVFVVRILALDLCLCISSSIQYIQTL